MSGFHRKNGSKEAAAQMAASKATLSKLLSVDYRCVELGLALATFAAVVLFFASIVYNYAAGPVKFPALTRSERHR